MNKGLTIRTNQAPVNRQWPRLFEHIQAGYLSPHELVTHHVPLALAGIAFVFRGMARSVRRGRG